jgi:acetylglutamate kinase
MLTVVTMVYGGLINKNIVAGLQARGCQAIGLTGADGNILPAKKREVKEIDYGFVGDVQTVNTGPLAELLENGFSVVFAPLTHDQQGNLLNTNADTIAAALACALIGRYDVRLIFCFEKKGVLASPGREDSLIPEISFSQYQQLKSAGIISAGMIPKMDNAFKALKSGVPAVLICHAADVREAAAGQKPAGTTLLAE